MNSGTRLYNFNNLISTTVEISMNSGTKNKVLTALKIYDSRNFNELGNQAPHRFPSAIYDSRNFNELGNFSRFVNTFHIYDSRNFNELGNFLCARNRERIYDSRNFNELGNCKLTRKSLRSTTVEISMNSGTARLRVANTYIYDSRNFNELGNCTAESRKYLHLRQ